MDNIRICRKDNCTSIADHGLKCRKCYSKDYRNSIKGKKRDASYQKSASKLKSDRAERIRVRQLAIAHYSNNLNICACCAETTFEFLTLDHINDDGYIWKKQTKNRNLARWLKVNNWPKGIQVLCMNCNHAKSKYNGCPHQKNEKRVLHCLQ